MSDPGQNESQTVLERHLQSHLAEHLSYALGEELTLVGVEAPVPFGRIDILALDTCRSLVAIELKIGIASRDAIAQLQSYMGALELENPETFVRGILVAAFLDEKAEAALRIARDIRFVSYQVSFDFKRGASSPEAYEAWLSKKQKKPESLREVASRFCSQCRAATPTEEKVSQHNYEYKCLNCGKVSVFEK